jgi:alanyl-tRNA synthetase
VTAGESSRFVGYERIGGEAAIRSYRVVPSGKREGIGRRRPQGSLFEFVVESTPFYATSGGQAADHGWIEIGGRRLEVRDVFKRGGEIVHLAESDESAETVVRLIEEIKRARLGVDDRVRVATAANHTATHLLHAALREVVGRHVTQAGSLVDGERLRFDFSHFQALSAEERVAVEGLVNRWVRDCIPVGTEQMPFREAVRAGAIALFDEKYGAEVRVVRVGDVSVELCGGTHIDNTGRIGLFLILSESGVAAGTRRIEALTGARALEHVQGVLARADELAAELGVSPADVIGRMRALLEEVEAARKRIRRLEQGGGAADLERLIAAAVTVGGVLVAVGRVNVEDIAALRNMADLFRGRVASGVAVLSATIKDKLQFVAAVTDDLARGGALSADALVRELGPIAGGGGGGKRHLALFGTKNLETEEAVFRALPATVERLLGS